MSLTADYALMYLNDSFLSVFHETVQNPDQNFRARINNYVSALKVFEIERERELVQFMSIQNDHNNTLQKTRLIYR